MTGSDDPRVRTGLERQLADRRATLDAGATSLGWKAGYGIPAVLEALKLGGPLLGHMTDASLLDDGAELAIGDWGAPMIEPEIAVRLRVDVSPGSTRDQVAEAIDAIAPAIELVDFVGTDPQDVEAVVGANIFHRHVVLGAWDEGRAGVDLAGVTLDVQAGDEPLAQDADPLELVGDPVEVVRWLADLMEGTGEVLRAGEIVITGTAIPGVPVQSGTDVLVRYRGLGDVRVRLT